LESSNNCSLALLPNMVHIRSHLGLHISSDIIPVPREVRISSTTHCCDKRDSLMRGVSSSVSRDKQTPPHSAITLLHARNGDDTRRCSSHRCHSQISRKSRFLPQLGSPRRNIAVAFGVKKTRVVWLSDGEKNRSHVYSF